MIARTLVGLTLLLAGCVGYTTYDPTSDSKLDMRGPHDAAITQAISTALRWSVRSLPPTLSADRAKLGETSTAAHEGEVAVSLPRGISAAQYRTIVNAVGADGAVQGETRPTYHIGRVEMRGSRARIDVHRPLASSRHQPVTINLQGGLDAWRVERFNAWQIGTMPVPAINPMPEG